MFENSNFDKLSDEFDRIATNFEMKLIGTFASLPRALQDAFKDKGALDGFTQGFGALGNNVDEVEASLKKVNDQMGFIEGQKNQLNELIKKIKERRQEDNKSLLEIVKQSKSTDDLVDSEQYRLDVLDKYKEKLDKLTGQQKLFNDALELGRKKTEGLNAAHEKALHTSKLNQFLHRHFGITHEDAKEHFKRKFFSKFALGTLLAEGLALALRSLATGYMNMRGAGESASQAVPNIGSTIGNTFRGMGTGVFAGPATYGKTIGALGNNLGTTDISNGMAIEGSRLTSQYGLSSEQSAGMLGQMLRMSNYSTKTATNIVVTARNLANNNRFPVGTALKDIADNSQIFATYARRGVAEFAKGDIAVRRMGTNLKTINGFANSLVDDFEGSLKMQATLQTYLPSLDLSGTMYAAQFGTEQQVAEQLQTALKKTGLTDLGSLPRSIRNDISKTLGVPMDQLQNMLSNNPNQQTVKGKSTDYNDTKESFENAIADAVAQLAKTISSLTILSASALMAAKALSLTAGSSLGGLGGLGKGAGLLSKVGTAGKILGTIGGGIVLGHSLYDIGKSTINHGTSGGLHALDRRKFSIAGGVIGSFIEPGGGTAIGAGLGGMVDSMGWNFPKSSETHHTGGIAGLFHALDHLRDGDVPAVLQKGERVLTTAQTGNLSKFVTAAVAMNKADAVSTNIKSTSSIEQQDSSSTNKKVEDLLERLINAVKDGKTIQLDGKKVGETLVNSYRGR